MIRRKFATLLGLGSFVILLWILTLSQESVNSSTKKKNDECRCESMCSTKMLSSDISSIDCRINEDVYRNLGIDHSPSNLNCLKVVNDQKSEEVFLPFSFLKTYFDVKGEVRSGPAEEYFSWSHSYSRVFPALKEQKYNPLGSFMQFSVFDVENRPRVKCVSASFGVPLTTQWDQKGYYYPTQICQYALAHWSKHIEETRGSSNLKSISETIYEDGDKYQANWIGGDITRVLRDRCVSFENSISLPLNNVKRELILGFDLQLRDNVTITVSLRSQKSGRVKLRYIPHVNLDLDRSGRTGSFGYGIVSVNGSPGKINRKMNSVAILEGEWKRFTRNLANDLAKVFPQKAFAPLIQVEDISFEGFGCVTNLSLSTRQSLRFFFSAADWLLQNQDKNGGWPVTVVFNKGKSKYSEADEIQPDWYSGMAQGHALSVLTRAFHQSKDVKYLSAAVRALKLFQVSSLEGGFSAQFMGSNYTWYEEYPTRPNTFILNGFMYALVGLHDLRETLRVVSERPTFGVEEENIAFRNDPAYSSAEALSGKLFDEGLNSLRTLLPLFDTGSGTFYDLRHLTMKTQPKLARWDYHSTHINQLYVLSTIVDDLATKNFFLSTADRWLGYMVGKVSKHN